MRSRRSCCCKKIHINFIPFNQIFEIKSKSLSLLNETIRKASLFNVKVTKNPLKENDIKNIDKIDWNVCVVYFKDGISEYVVSKSHKKEIDNYGAI